MPIYLRRLLVVFPYCRSLSINHYLLLLIVDIFDDVCNEVFCFVIVMYSLCIRIVFVLLIFTLMIYFLGKENYRGKIVDDGFGALTYNVDADLNSEPLPEPANAAYYHK